jgi:hypothetical protein
VCVQGAGSYVASRTSGADSGWLRVCVWVCVCVCGGGELTSSPAFARFSGGMSRHPSPLPLRQAGSGRATERLPAACTGARSAERMHPGVHPSLCDRLAPVARRQGCPLQALARDQQRFANCDPDLRPKSATQI